MLLHMETHQRPGSPCRVGGGGHTGTRKMEKARAHQRNLSYERESRTPGGTGAERNQTFQKISSETARYSASDTSMKAGRSHGTGGPLRRPRRGNHVAVS